MLLQGFAPENPSIMGMRFNRLGTLLDISKLTQLSLESPSTLKSSDDHSIITFAAKKFKIPAEQLEISKGLETDEEGFKHVTLRQVLGGVPVYGCEVKLHIEKDGKMVYAATGKSGNQMLVTSCASQGSSFSGGTQQQQSGIQL
jgi:Zn-dependent metalloprotease